MVGLLGNELCDPSHADSIVTAWSKLYKREIIIKNNVKFVSTKEKGTEDLLFNISYLEHSKTVYVLDLPLYHYRKDNFSSLTSSYKDKLFTDWQKLLPNTLEVTFLFYEN